MKAFGMEIKKQDVRDIYAEMGKDIKEGLNFNEFQGVMSARMVLSMRLRAQETPKTRFSRFLNCSTRTTSTRSPSKT